MSTATQQSAKCPQCGMWVDPARISYCSRCGASLNAPTQSRHGPPEPPVMMQNAVYVRPGRGHPVLLVLAILALLVLVVAALAVLHGIPSGTIPSLSGAAVAPAP